MRHDAGAGLIVAEAADPRVAEARVEAVRGDPERAFAVLGGVLAAEPDHLEALLLLAALSLQEREEERALALFERAVALAPRSVEARNGLARCLHALGRDELALATANEAKRLLASGDLRQASAVYLTLVWCLREQRRWREALAAAEEGLERSPDAVLAQWASVVEEELAEAEKDRC
jgi:tetratricopeptide (TPR) repeat protein